MIAAATVVQRAAQADPAVPGVVAGVTDRETALCFGAAGSRDLGMGEPTTTDTVVAVFSTLPSRQGPIAGELWR